MLWDIETITAGGWLHDGRSNRRILYRELGQTIEAVEKVIGARDKLLVALVADNSPACIACYLAALRCGHAVLLLNAGGDASLREGLLRRYLPEVMLLPRWTALPKFYKSVSVLGGFVCCFLEHSAPGPIHPDLAVLLTSSGTTGNPKLIRLSHGNLQSNAASIASYLGIDAAETAVTSLPISYSYGLSVVNSHLLRGGNLVCTDESVVSGRFWQLFRECGCTSFAGVPHSYLMLERLRLDRMSLPTLRTLTQAGGRLAKDKVEHFSQLAARIGCRFFVMYGQTEATARICYVPWERLAEKAGSVGIAIPGGSIRIVGEGGHSLEPRCEGEVVYEGPNVMMGYAENRDDLAIGDQLCGVLQTGDIGYLDDDGFLYITGRLNRFVKVFGHRVNLDDVERMLEDALSVPVACVGSDDHLFVLLESSDDQLRHEARQRIASLYHIHHSALEVQLLPSIPVTAAGKKDYPAMRRELKL
ncbi:AMP-binding protein [Geomonas anaerohicana]|uniref:AMP-binding protein n=1 Tax=Geomonas anaerohicana TaxID=2798583 RepID=A0ABS0YC03_9BACT|nr:AMP-binding protein [Geomonas anaerohicana]MBJ6749866.1 AMP-binding protein [Geomonas anaerohicana]